MISRLIFTPGEPAGIGPDIALQLAQTGLDFELVYMANTDLLNQRAKTLNLKIHIDEFDFTRPPYPNKKGQIKLIHKNLGKVIAGQLNPKHSDYVLDCIEDAAKYTADKKFDALVTGPVHKGIINEGGFEFSGHTEFLQSLTKREKVVMLLANNKMKVALVTTHLPLKEVSGAMNPQEIINSIKILHQSLCQDFGISRPKIIVSGLNPHAGEDGYLGDEEITIITPAIQSCLEQNMDIIGPVSADTMFSPQNLKDADAFLVMFHDQGLPVLKYAGFGSSANITLGLPFIRTSVDHGTALELAGSGKSIIGSLQQALNQALLIAQNHA